MRNKRINISLAILGLFMLVGLPLAANASINSKLKTQNSKLYQFPMADPGDWPTYGHDNSRTNFNPAETTISAANVSQLVQRWQANIGSSSTATSNAPSVANGKVYVGSSVATGNNFFAFDAQTGGPAWSTSVNYVSSCFNVGIGSTAAISGTVVSVGGGDSAFYGLDANTGAQLWRNPMNVGSSGFPWESPLLAYGRSYLGIASRCDNPSVRGEVRTVDMFTGNQMENVYFVPQGNAGAGVWNSPALSPDGSTLVVATGEDYGGYNGPYNRAIVSLNPTTLALIQWNQQGATGGDLDYGTTPLFFSDSAGRVLVAANHKNGVFYTFVLSNITGGPTWQRSTGTIVGMMPAYDPTFGSGGTLFIAGSSSRIFAVDPATGTDRWPAITAGTMHGNMAIANGLIFVNTGSSGLKIFDETNGSLLRTLTPTGLGSANSGVAVSHGIVYWQAGSNLNAWGFAGTPTPTFTPSDTPTITPTRPTDTPTRTPTVTPTRPTDTPTRTPTITPTRPTDTPTGTSTPGPSHTAGPSSTAVDTPIDSPTSTPTGASTVVATNTPTGVPTACSISFTDVQPSDYFYAPVRYLFCRGVISGYGTEFRPYNNTSRGQLCKIVVLGFNLPINVAGGPHFVDVPTSNVFYPYVETLFNRGTIAGYGTEFRPNDNVSRGQLCKIVVLAAGWDINTTGGPHFTDVLVGSTFYSYVETAYNHAIISGYGTLFKPNDPATRGQISKIVYLALGAPPP